MPKNCKKTEKLGDLQLILAVANAEIIFPSEKIALENKKVIPSRMTCC